MHEATIAESILKIAARKLSENPEADAVGSIELRIGEFRNVEMESLAFAFDSLKGLYKGFGGCMLYCNTVKAAAVCRRFGHKYHPDFSLSYCCPDCGSGIGKLIKGEELEIVKLSLLALNSKEQKACTSH